MVEMSHSKKYGRGLLIGSIVLVCLISFAFWLYGKFYVSTDDAYVNANVVQIAPRVSGQVMVLAVANNQHVNAGDLLFALDPAVFQARLAHDEATLARAEAVKSIAEITSSRTRELVSKHAASTQEGDIMDARLQSAVANVSAANAAVTTSRLDLQYSKITAPTGGGITQLTLREGDVVRAGQALFALVSDNEFWIDANFRETEVGDIMPGQHADIRIDMYPGHHFHGVVESISSGSGAVFSLLPPENATGNWVKVTQRVPVRVRVVDVNPKYPLRIGTSATVTIRLTGKS